MNIINYTPHAITIRQGPVASVTVPPSGKVARVATEKRFAGHIHIGSLAVISNCRVLGEVEIPDPGPDIWWILVSSMVLEAARVQGHPLLNRLCAPDTEQTAIREGGQVIAVTQLVVA